MPQDLDTKLVLIIDKSAREICICTIVIRTDVSIPNLDRVSSNVFATQISRERYLMVVLICINVNAFILFGVYILRSN